MIRSLLLAITCGLALMPTAVQGHMILARSDPPDGAHLAQAPTQAVLEFNKPLGPTAYVILTGPAGQLPTPQPQVSGHTLTVATPDGGEGHYRLAFRAVSAQGHPLTGSISYTVGQVTSEQVPVTRGSSGSGGSSYPLVLGAGLTGLVAAGIVLLINRGRRDQAGSAQ